MDTTFSLARPDVTRAVSAPRPTPQPARIPFAEVLARGASGLVRGAEGALSALPGGPLVAVALRGGSGTSTSRPLAMSLSPEGPGAIGGSSASTVGGTLTGGTGSAGGAGDANLDSTLAQSQEMNMYYLQIQEQVNQENRTYSAFSNVLKAEHDTVKTAIGNIR